MFRFGVSLLLLCTQKYLVTSAPSLRTYGNEFNPVNEPQFSVNSHNSLHSSIHNLFPFAWDLNYPLDTNDQSKLIPNIDNNEPTDHHSRLGDLPIKPKIAYANDNGLFNSAKGSPLNKPSFQWPSYSFDQFPPFNFNHNFQTLLPFPQFSNNFPTLPPFSPIEKQNFPTLPPFSLMNRQNFPTLPPLSSKDKHNFPTLPPRNKPNNFPTLPPRNKPQNFPTIPPFSPMDTRNFPTLPPLSQMGGHNFPSLPLFSLMDRQNLPTLPPLSSRNKPNTFPVLPSLPPFDKQNFSKQNFSTLPPLHQQNKDINAHKLSPSPLMDTQDFQTLPTTKKPFDITEQSIDKKMYIYYSNVADKEEPLQTNFAQHQTHNQTSQNTPRIETKSPNLLSHLYKVIFPGDEYANEEDEALNVVLVDQEKTVDMSSIGVPLQCSRGRCFCPPLHFYDSQSGRCAHQNSVWSV